MVQAQKFSMEAGLVESIEEANRFSWEPLDLEKKTLHC
jgi:hypothetical protein